MQKKNIRWIQRLSSYRQALLRLEKAVNLMTSRFNNHDETDDLIKDGLIKRFEYTHELSWKVMKDYAEYQGFLDIRGSRDAFRKAVEMGLINDKRWMESIEDRNRTSHHYDNEIAKEIFNTILTVYFPLFQSFEKTMLSLSTKN